MPHEFTTTERYESELFQGVSAVLHKMTEGRRIELRKLIADPNRKIRGILREQSTLEKEPEETRDFARWLELQDEFDEIVITQLNPAWIKWGVESLEGLIVKGETLGVGDVLKWPSALMDEVLTAVKAEAELNGTERKNLSSPTTFGAQGDSNQKPLTAENAASEGGGATETANSITLAG